MTEISKKLGLAQPVTDKSVQPAPHDPLWFKDAVIYQLHVKAFFDSNNDGMGDFAGLTSKLDYLQGLGVNTLWLLPFYPSPMRDDGYDIADYGDVNPAYGTLDDFKKFVEESHARGMRVITELVINHTSDQHPWFQAARKAPPGSPERDLYVWSDNDQKYAGTRIIFSDTETSNWTWDPVAGQYFWHRFFSHQPDLNFDNPALLDKLIEVMYYWLDMGVDGLRLDAVPYLVEREGTNNENLPETHDVIRKLRAALDARYSDRLLLAEANQWPEDVQAYFGLDAEGKGDECHMAFHFPLMPRLYMAVAQEDRHPITDIMHQTPTIPPNCQWATFLRNHDELTLEMVTDRERDYLWNFYAADKRARINFGIRRRLAPLMENDRRKIELLNGLLMSMPGTPIIYYGDEIGMGDNIYLGDRNGVRTPMQWTPDRNGGFSRTDPAQLYLPSIMDAIYGYASINVKSQARVQYSLYNWMRNLIATVKTSQAFGRGNLRFLTPKNRKVLAYIRTYENETILCVANLSHSPQPAELDLKEFNGKVPFEMVGHSTFPAIGTLPYFLTLAPYGFFWFKLNDMGEMAADNALPELLTLVLPRGWDSLSAGKTRQALAEKILPQFLARQRWYKNHGPDAVLTLKERFPLGDFQLIHFDVKDGEAVNDYLIAVGIAWETLEDDPLPRLHASAISRVRQFNRIGVLYEACASEAFLRQLLAAIKNGQTITGGDAQLSFEGAEALAGIDPGTVELQPLGAEQTNSLVRIGDSAIFKFVRQPQPGINPEEEIGKFLATASPYDRVPKFLSSLRIARTGGVATTIGVLQQSVNNQGNGWQVTLDYLKRYVGDAAVSAAMAGAAAEDAGYYLPMAERLGQRTGEMHRALGKKTGNTDFDPEAISATDREAWIGEAEGIAADMFTKLEQALPKLEDNVSAYVRDLISRKVEVSRHLREALPRTFTSGKTRVHGDYHLGQVLVADNDFYIIDFEGEPARPIAERRLKYSAYRDVAGMLRSFDYAAAMALRQSISGTPDDVKTIATSLDVWRDRATESFLHGYRAVASLPREEEDALLHFFLMRKALYEVIYEEQHRPDWLSIPVMGLLALMDEHKERAAPATKS